MLLSIIFGSKSVRKMKQIVIVRHAKTEVQQSGQDDFSRRLTDRGKRNAEDLGKYLKLNDLIPDQMLVSTAKRTQSTAKRICAEIGLKEEGRSDLHALYAANLQTILYCLEEVSPKSERICLVAHNPGVQFLAEYLLPFSLPHLVPGSMVAIDIDSEQGGFTKAQSGRLRLLWFPDRE
jgi:phosphohistidine phosphatase